jgi:hypothetical protein
MYDDVGEEVVVVVEQQQESLNRQFITRKSPKLTCARY